MIIWILNLIIYLCLTIVLKKNNDLTKEDKILAEEPILE